MRTVLVFDCPPTMQLEALREHFGCTGIIWPAGNAFIYGYLHLTDKHHHQLALVKDVEYFSYGDLINEHRHLSHGPSAK